MQANDTYWHRIGTVVQLEDPTYTLLLPTSEMATVTDPALNAAVTTAIIDAHRGVIIVLTVAGNAQTLQSPSILTGGKEFIVANSSTSTHTIEVDGYTLEPGEAQSFTWDGSAWCYAKASGEDRLDTIYIDAAEMIPCTTNGALQGTKEYGTNDIDVDYFAFDAGATKERVQFKLKMPENWDKGTIKAKFDWSSDTGSTAADTVEWAIKAGALSDNDAIDAALGTPQVISDALLADNGADLQISGATPALAVGGTPAISDMIMFELYRNTDGSDLMAEDAWLFGVTLQYNKSGAVAAW